MPSKKKKSKLHPDAVRCLDPKTKIRNVPHARKCLNIIAKEIRRLTRKRKRKPSVSQKHRGKRICYYRKKSTKKRGKATIAPPKVVCAGDVCNLVAVPSGPAKAAVVPSTLPAAVSVPLYVAATQPVAPSAPPPPLIVPEGEPEVKAYEEYTPTSPYAPSTPVAFPPTPLLGPLPVAEVPLPPAEAPPLAAPPKAVLGAEFKVGDLVWVNKSVEGEYVWTPVGVILDKKDNDALVEWESEGQGAQEVIPYGLLKRLTPEEIAQLRRERAQQRLLGIRGVLGARRRLRGRVAKARAAKAAAEAAAAAAVEAAEAEVKALAGPGAAAEVKVVKKKKEKKQPCKPRTVRVPYSSVPVKVHRNPATGVCEPCPESELYPGSAMGWDSKEERCIEPKRQRLSASRRPKRRKSHRAHKRKRTISSRKQSRRSRKRYYLKRR